MAFPARAARDSRRSLDLDPRAHRLLRDWLACYFGRVIMNHVPVPRNSYAVSLDGRDIFLRSRDRNDCKSNGSFVAELFLAPRGPHGTPQRSPTWKSRSGATAIGLSRPPGNAALALIFRDIANKLTHCRLRDLKMLRRLTPKYNRLP